MYIYSGTSLQRPCLGSSLLTLVESLAAFRVYFFIVVDHCGPFTLAVVKNQVVLQSPFVERFHCISAIKNE